MKTENANPLFRQMNIQTLMVMIAAFLFLSFLVFPKGKEIFSNKLSLEEKKIRLNNANAAIGRLPALTRDLFKVKNLVNHESNLFLKPDEIADLLLLVDSSIGSLKLSLLSVSPEQNSLSQDLQLGPKILFNFLPVNIELRGPYEDIALFVHRLTNQEKLVLIDRVNIENSQNDLSKLTCRSRFLFFLKKNHAEVLKDDA